MSSRQYDVAFVVPAFSDVHTPSLGVSVLASQCQQASLRTYVHYANLDLWTQHPDAYALVSRAPNEALLGEMLFAPHAFETTRVDPLELIGQVRRGLAHTPTKAELEGVTALRQDLDQHIERTVSRLLEIGAPIVGLTSSFQQNAACLAIARRLKARSPSTLIVMGGANLEGAMGRALLEIAPNIDVVFSGEADVAFPQFVKDRTSSHSHPRFVDCAPLATLSDTSGPDYADYFSQLEQLPFSTRMRTRFPHYLPFESSRGCWWGQRHHCTFCGLNGQGMAYRPKDVDAVLLELAHLHARWGEANFSATDNIIQPPARSELLQRLARSGLPFNLFFETKANLTIDDLKALCAAGVHAIQPGIEALSSRILRKIAKGLTAPQAVCLLRDAIAMGIELYWNLFSEIPDDVDEDYSGLAQLIPQIVHLRPPVGVGPVRVDRFSPYFNEPARFGIKALRPFSNYRHVYPPGADLNNLAYHFEYEREAAPVGDVNRSAFVSAAKDWQKRWRIRSSRPRLSIEILADGRAQVRDSRSADTPTTLTLTSDQMATLATFLRPQAKRRMDEPICRSLLEAKLIVLVEDALVCVVPLDPTPSVQVVTHASPKVLEQATD